MVKTLALRTLGGESRGVQRLVLMLLLRAGEDEDEEKTLGKGGTIAKYISSFPRQRLERIGTRAGAYQTSQR